MLLAAALTVAGCFQKEKDYDAVGYVKSSLDAVYRQDYKGYAKYLNKSEKEAKETMEQDFQEKIKQYDDMVKRLIFWQNKTKE